jgi:two-component system KDP operon response regulator KdpE
MSEHVPVILLVEDEAAIRRFLRTVLEGQGFRVLEAGMGSQALALAAARRPDIVLLDLGLPDMEGLQVLQRLREWTDVPVLILSARGQDDDKVQGLDAGADDYLTKPFSVIELSARLRVALRHAARRKQGGEPPVFQVGGLRVDLLSRHVWIDGQEIHLTPIQYKLLTVLIRHAGQVVTQKQLLREVWGANAEGESAYVRIYVHQLRRKLEADPVRPRYLQTEPGAGYRLIGEE